jgi:hypothetical protein
MSFLARLLPCLLVSQAALAGPWLDPGDSAMRHDIQVLADAGVITGPVSTWPLSWGDIKVSLQEVRTDLRPEEQEALMRVERELAKADRQGELVLHGRVSAAEYPRKIRSFEGGPRESGEIGGGVEWTGSRFAFRLQGQRVNDPDDGKDWRADDSYLGVALGNWTVAASTSDRYWGPGWQSSMILSNNARPIPAFAVERNLTTPFKTRWLRWMGSWDFAALWGYLDDDRAISSARVFSARLDMRPLKSLEIGLSGMGLWCGSGQGCDAGDFADLVTGSGKSSSFDRLASLDVRWSGKIFNTPIALYTHWVGEDFGDGATRKLVPEKLLGQFGAETWGYWDGLGSVRFFVEWADTECDFEFYRTISGDGGGGIPGCGYRNATYESGQTYRGRSLAHSLDQDSSVASFGGLLNDKNDRSWFATLAIGKLNRRGATKSTVSRNEADYAEVEVSHGRTLGGGKLRLGLGYEYRDDQVTNNKNDDIRAFFEWRVEY